jgi:hypothetical protein
LPDDGHEPVRPIPEGDLREHGWRDLDKGCPALLQRVEGGARVRPDDERRADERVVDGHGLAERPEELATTVHQRQTGCLALASVAKADGRLHPRVGKTPDRGRRRAHRILALIRG